MLFSADALPYSLDALVAKGISKEQVTFHYEKHHKGYATKLNAALETRPDLSSKSLTEIIKTVKGPIFNSAAQLWNHNFYWKSMSARGGGVPKGVLLQAINDSFGSFEKFKFEFSAVANGHFGSGWVWLVKDTTSGKLKVHQTHDGGCAITEGRLVPILTCDVWEHAYYVDYKNDRAGYVDAWWRVANWKFAESNYLAASGSYYRSSDL